MEPKDPLWFTVPDTLTFGEREWTAGRSISIRFFGDRAHFGSGVRWMPTLKTHTETKSFVAPPPLFLHRFIAGNESANIKPETAGDLVSCRSAYEDVSSGSPSSTRPGLPGERRSKERLIDLSEGNEMIQWRRLWVAVLGIVVGSGVFVNSASAASEDDYYELMKVFVDTFEQIDRNYVTQVDRRELMEAAMRGMLLKLDPYSSYIDNTELKSFNEHVEQEFGGIGIQVTVDPRSRQLMVMTPLPGTPAYKAGVLAGDRILEIDDKPTADFQEGREMDSAVKLMRGKPGAMVKVKLQHIGSENPETFEITRATIKTPTVLGDHYDAKGDWSFMFDEQEKIAYIRLTSFGRNSAEEIHDALARLQKEGMRGLVLDMRFNPGGLLTAATAIADFFISSGVIVSTKGRNTEEQFVKAKKAGTFSGFPMVILVNRYSASASEIVSACLQDHKRAIIVGERTWGKGSVQNVIELEGGKSALKLTTASYHRPSGKNIHRFPKATEKDEWGVMPDEGYNLKMTDEELKGLFDSQRERDVIRGDAAAAKRDFVDKQLDAGVTAIKKLLADGKPIVEQPVERAVEEEKKADDKKAAGTSMTVPVTLRPYVDALLEFWRVQPGRRIQAA
jgi:carboxyl-terminal processing protease